MSHPCHACWLRCDGETRPEANKDIIIATEDRRVMRGYMRSSVWPGETKPTYSFHGEYYDFQKHKLSFCLVNAMAWMPLPDFPAILQTFEDARRRAKEGEFPSAEI